MSPTSWSAAVLVSAGRHPVTGMQRACRGDATALALGRQLAGDALRVLHAGPADEPALQDYLAHGAGSIEAVESPAGQDIVQALLPRLREIDLLLTGTRTENGAGSGLLPYALAQALGRPLLANVLEAEVQRDRVAVRQFLPKGKRRSVSATLPVILVIHPLAPVDLTYAYARRRSGRIVIVNADAAGRDTQVTATAPPWRIEDGKRRPVKLKANENLSGHARMQAATSQVSKSGLVVNEGDSVGKAQVILAYLRDHRLIEF
jgi:electron transfer flavoprotein beta subunit